MGANNIGNLTSAMMPDDNSLSQGDAHSADGETRAFLMRPFPTLGEHLAHETRRRVSHYIPTFPWLRPLETVMEHLTSLPVPSQERFQRIEAPHNPATFPHQGAAAPGTGSDNPLMAFGQSSMQERKVETARLGQPLPPHLQQRLQPFVGHGTEQIRIHDDEASHTLAQAQRADAVTIGQHIFFGQNRFRPHQDEGFALLTHEAHHVTQAIQPGRAWQRATQAGIQEEEQEAITLESQALHARRNASWKQHPALPSLRPAHTQHPTAAATPGVASGLAPSAPALHLMRAATNRSLEEGIPLQSTMPNIDELKRVLYRDLMRQIKAEMERGG